jgi:hypothetical protein
MKKTVGRPLEDVVKFCNEQYDKVKEKVYNGIIEKDEIVRALNMKNQADWKAILENKRHLLA